MVDNRTLGQNRNSTEYILGIAKVGKGLKILVDIEKALTSTEYGIFVARGGLTPTSA